MNQQAIEIINKWFSWRELTLDQMYAQLGAVNTSKKENASYGNLKNLTALENEDSYPGLLFYKDNRFVLSYVDEMYEELEGWDPQALLAHWGEPDAILRSRAGKRFRQHVFASQGITIATDGQSIAFLEIYEPMSLENYETQFYIKPKSFTR